VTAFFNFIRHGGERKLFPVSGPYPNLEEAKLAKPADVEWLHDRDLTTWFDEWFSGPADASLKTIRGEYEKEKPETDTSSK